MSCHCVVILHACIIKKIKAPIGDENGILCEYHHICYEHIKKIKAPIGDENIIISTLINDYVLLLRK